MKITIYTTSDHDVSDIKEQILDALKSHFETTKSEALEIFNSDELAKVKIVVTVGEIEEG